MPIPITHKTYAAKARPQSQGAEAEDRKLSFIITSDRLDRDGEVVLPQGMRFREYLANPVVMWAHDLSKPPVAKCLGIELINGGRALRADFEFSDLWFGKQLYKLYSQGFLNSVSVGFRAVEAVAPWPEILRARPELKDCRRIITRSELYEISCVPIPSNVDAMREAVRKGVVSREVADAIGRSDPVDENEPRDSAGNPLRRPADEDADEEIEGAAADARDRPRRKPSAATGGDEGRPAQATTLTDEQTVKLASAIAAGVGAALVLAHQAAIDTIAEKLRGPRG
jgi:HK97 family phage prohead protease